MGPYKADRIYELVVLRRYDATWCSTWIPPFLCLAAATDYLRGDTHGVMGFLTVPQQGAEGGSIDFVHLSRAVFPALGEHDVRLIRLGWHLFNGGDGDEPFTVSEAFNREVPELYCEIATIAVGTRLGDEHRRLEAISFIQDQYVADLTCLG